MTDLRSGAILALQRATHATLHALARELAGLGLNSSETNVLAVLADGRPRAVGELAVATATRPTTLTSVLDRLAGRGLVVRELDPADRRSFVVELTGPGRDTAAAVNQAVRRLERTALTGVSERDLAGFRAVLNALTGGGTMTGDRHHAGLPEELPEELTELLAQIVPPGARAGGLMRLGRAARRRAGGFGHREHVHLAFLAVRRYGTAEAAERIGRWLRHLTVYAGAPQKYNATVTWAWTEIVGHHLARDQADSGAAPMDFDSFAARHPRLLDKRLLRGHYSSSVLASARARTTWVEPDLMPFPWRQR